jgi:hypothetical protein
MSIFDQTRQSHPAAGKNRQEGATSASGSWRSSTRAGNSSFRAARARGFAGELRPDRISRDATNDALGADLFHPATSRGFQQVDPGSSRDCANDPEPRARCEGCSSVVKCAMYLVKNARWLHYDRVLADGLPIAIGVVEGACRHLVQAGTGRAGARWSLAGRGGRVTHARAAGERRLRRLLAVYSRNSRRIHASRYLDGTIPDPIPSPDRTSQSWCDRSAADELGGKETQPRMPWVRICSASATGVPEIASAPNAPHAARARVAGCYRDSTSAGIPK